MQTAVAEVDVYVPFGHAVQEVAWTGEKVPEGHGKALILSLHSWPAGHSLQFADALLFE